MPTCSMIHPQLRSLLSYVSTIPAFGASLRSIGKRHQRCPSCLCGACEGYTKGCMVGDEVCLAMHKWICYFDGVNLCNSCWTHLTGARRVGRRG